MRSLSVGMMGDRIFVGMMGDRLFVEMMSDRLFVGIMGERFLRSASLSLICWDDKRAIAYLLG